MDVSLICMTHGRSWLLRETAECFRRQQLGGLDAELLILNDCPEVEIRCSVPGVRCVNLKARIRNLGEKTNVAIEMARGRVFTLLDDDDLALPGFALDGIARMAGTLAYRPRLCWTLGVEGIRDYAGEPQLNGAFLTRKRVLDCGGIDTRRWNDQAIWDCFHPTRNVVEYSPTPAEMQFIYRWDGREWHVSGKGGEWEDTKADEFRKRVMADKRFVAGRAWIHPHWPVDYTALVCAAIRAGKGRQRPR